LPVYDVVTKRVKNQVAGVWVADQLLERTLMWRRPLHMLGVTGTSKSSGNGAPAMQHNVW